MLDTSDEFVFVFEKGISTDLLLRDHINSSTVREIDVLAIYGIRAIRVQPNTDSPSNWKTDMDILCVCRCLRIRIIKKSK